jgi:hypothetical protein
VGRFAVEFGFVELRVGGKFVAKVVVVENELCG